MIEPNFQGVFSLFAFHCVSIYMLFPLRWKRSKTVAVLCSLFVACFGICWVILQWSISFFSLGIAFLAAASLSAAAAVFLSAYDVPKTLFLFLLYAQAFIIAMTLAVFISQRFFGGSSFLAILVRAGLHIVILLMCAALRKKFDCSVQGIIQGWWPLNLLEILCFTYTSIFALRVYNRPCATAELVSFSLVLLIILAMYIVFYSTIHFMNRANRLEQAEQHSRFLLEEMKAMQEAMEETRRLRHDIRHHYLQIAEYVKTGENDALLQYLHEYEKVIKRGQGTRICENLAANSILCVYSRKAEQVGIDVQFDVSMEQDIGISDIDIVVILANLIENAIHGCINSKKQDASINVYIGKKAGRLVIDTRNTSAADVTIEHGIPKSKRGGIGIASILHSAKRYGGEFDFRNENGIFSCRIILKIPKNTHGRSEKITPEASGGAIGTK